MLAARIASSMIDRIAYDEEEGALSIWFRETGRYVYSNVPRAIYDGCAARRPPAAISTPASSAASPAAPIPNDGNSAPVSAADRRIARPRGPVTPSLGVRRA